MIIAAQIFMILSIVVSSVSFLQALYILSFEPILSYYIISITVTFIICLISNIIALIMLSKSKKQQHKVKGFTAIAIIELLVGGIIPGILMLCIKDDSFVKELDEKNNYESSQKAFCQYCGCEVTIYDKYCPKCGKSLKEKYQPSNVIAIPETLDENQQILLDKAMKLAVNYEKNRLIKINLQQYFGYIKIEEAQISEYKTNLLSVDLINNQMVKTFIKVKAFDEEKLDNVFKLTEEEINLLKLHANFRIYCLFDLSGSKKIRVITHENYLSYIK